jgi:hypothetical protein
VPSPTSSAATGRAPSSTNSSAKLLWRLSRTCASLGRSPPSRLAHVRRRRRGARGKIASTFGRE